jgi:hypothetical protein
VFEKLLLILLQGKSAVVAGALATGVVATSVVGGSVVTNLATGSEPVVAITAPTLGQDVAVSATGGTFRVTGWALDAKSETGTGIERVELYLDTVTAANLLGRATLGGDTPAGVAARYLDEDDDDQTRFDEAGWHFDWTVGDLSDGSHTLHVVATSSRDTRSSDRASVQINDPLVEITSPEAGTKVSGIVKLEGWARDRYDADPATALTSAQIAKVEIYVNDALQATDATLVDGTEKATWSFDWNAETLAAGEYTLTARAYSAAQTGAWTEASVLVVLYDPQDVSGNGCGWLVGKARGEAIHALQSGWQQFHGETTAYNSKMGSTDQDKRGELRAKVHGTSEGLREIRHDALTALHAKADEYLRLCLAGQLTGLEGKAFVTVEQDVVDTSHLLYDYRSIVDTAIAEMEELYEAAKSDLDTLSTGTGQQPGGKPEGAGKPADAGPPAQRGRP